MSVGVDLAAAFADPRARRLDEFLDAPWPDECSAENSAIVTPAWAAGDVGRAHACTQREYDERFFATQARLARILVAVNSRGPGAPGELDAPSEPGAPGAPGALDDPLRAVVFAVDAAAAAPLGSPPPAADDYSQLCVVCARPGARAAWLAVRAVLDAVAESEPAGRSVAVSMRPGRLFVEGSGLRLRLNLCVYSSVGACLRAKRPATRAVAYDGQTAYLTNPAAFAHCYRLVPFAADEFSPSYCRRVAADAAADRYGVVCVGCPASALPLEAAANPRFHIARTPGPAPPNGACGRFTPPAEKAAPPQTLSPQARNLYEFHRFCGRDDYTRPDFDYRRSIGATGRGARFFAWCPVLRDDAPGPLFADVVAAPDALREYCKNMVTQTVRTLLAPEPVVKNLNAIRHTHGLGGPDVTALLDAVRPLHADYAQTLEAVLESMLQRARARYEDHYERFRAAEIAWWLPPDSPAHGDELTPITAVELHLLPARGL
jgi:hypothetical protein